MQLEVLRMTQEYKIRVQVESPDRKLFCAALNVDAKYYPQMSPVDVCRSPFVAALVGGLSEAMMPKFTADRKKLAAQFAEAITAQLMKAMEAQDTNNGHPKE